MPVQCKICNQEFLKLITSTHLKKHNILTKEYIDIYGKDSLASQEYRQEKSKSNTGENNPNFGNKMSNESKQKISQLKLGTQPWNAGLKYTETSKQKQAAKKREEKYRSGELTRHTIIMTGELKQKISKSVKAYADTNTDEIKQRAKKAVETKKEKGYYEVKRKETEKSFIKKCQDFGFLVESVENKIAVIRCNNCNSTSSRSISSLVHQNMCPICTRVGTSNYEQQLLEELKKFVDSEVVISDRSILGNLELDFYIPKYQFAIELNGLYWHSEQLGKGRFYHKYKTDRCQEKGIQLIHIFEDEWLTKKDICIERIKSKLNLSSGRVYARNCRIKSLTNAEAYDFLTKYHIQGRGTAANFCYGLIDNNDNLQAVMTFSKLNISKGSKHIEDHYELNRYASVGNVVGGASKLFQHFLKNVQPTTVISYADLRWNTGQLYNKLGFDFVGNTLPGYWYVKGVERIHRFKLRKTQQDSVDITEKELRESQGYLRIWDCGNSKWQWTRKN